MCFTKDERLLFNSYLLYNELKRQFCKYKEPYMLMRQLKKYILGIEAHNLELLYNINIGSLGNWTFNYREIIKGKKIVIYGAGACGQAFYTYLMSENMDTQIVGWVDINPDNKSEQCLYKIEYPEVLLQLQFDYIVIAILKEDMAKKIQIELSEMYNIERKKIIWEKTTYVPIFK